ncbi:hypothetical protein FA13DRAFT_1791208 [Coprinellus micaceus]|uniref:DUF6570 domain-containing protein n=1 Tax=Coprinellus micaceus TaxID=71717 RepID=A0A4Y7TD28_COPMI|nr:hypothetical protein FA13DRAFT_1791208 [Coprinellus micaceus]
MHYVSVPRGTCGRDLPSKLHWGKLEITDDFIIKNCILAMVSNEFNFENPHLDGLMLDKAGISHRPSENLDQVNRGQLPDEFNDLTWVEEMACSIYRNMAHVTRLFASSSPEQPKVLHGNTCAHEMNVVSTASVLPHTPADIHGMLSVVFVGPGDFDPAKAGSLFRVRKDKIWRFLMWLKAHNRLYSGLHFSKNSLELFPDDGPLPGLANATINQQVTCDHVKQIFGEETAGIEDHPASHILEAGNHISNPEPMVERMGVMDPEHTRIPAHTLTASALQRPAPSDDLELPDLVLHRRSDPIPEYNNPDLLPRMYPTLFPFGIGGFEDHTHPTALAFDSQAQYYLNIHGKSFRYHFSYLFVILNMIQCWKAHLQTHFTVQTS